MNSKIALYVHAHWNYRHPYAARTWTLDDWRGFLRGLKSLGYNAVMIWPMLETMPLPPTSSDAAYLQLLSQVIDFAHDELDFHVTITLCPNVQANARAADYDFENRPYFACDERIDPADETARREFFARREALLRPLSGADAVAVIDSDPGGWPGSPDADFTRLLSEHRQMLDRLRPGIELNYWMLIGWEAYNRWWESGVLERYDAADMTRALLQIKELNPEPWGLFANEQAHVEAAREAGLESRVLWFPYAMIEGEPLFPMTIYPPREGVGTRNPGAPRGVMGNAQTHCVQLPGIFAFARGTQGEGVSRDDFIAFAERLVPNHGALIERAWRVLASGQSSAMKEAATLLHAALHGDLPRGDLSGLLLQSPQRFLEDLILQLRLRAALADMKTARAGENAGTDVRAALLDLASTLEAWQARTGFSKPSGLVPGEIAPLLSGLHNAKLQEALQLGLDFPDEWTTWDDEGRAAYALRQSEELYPRLLAALREIAHSMG